MGEPYYSDDAVNVYAGDCLDVMRGLPDASIDSVVTDPPYSLGFLGRDWDTHGGPKEFEEWCRTWAEECLRLLKPGGHLMAFGAPRTWHRLASGVEDAGFEIRDSIAWLNGNGYPKSQNIAKSIDKKRHDREDILRVTGWLKEWRDRAGVTNRQIDELFGFNGMASHWVAMPSNSVAELPSWDQWLQLKEFLCFGDELDAEVWRLHGRKGTPGEAWQTAEVLRVERRHNMPNGIVGIGQGERVLVDRQIKAANSEEAKRWQGWGTALKPAFEPIVVARKPMGNKVTVGQNIRTHGTGAVNIAACRVDSGGWPPNVALDGPQADLLHRSRDVPPVFPVFRYEGKAPASERPQVDGVRHPTVKPLDLMRWLVRLVTPPGGLVLDPFAGSGTTAQACVSERFRCMAIEQHEPYLQLIVQRLSKPMDIGFDFEEVS